MFEAHIIHIAVFAHFLAALPRLRFLRVPAWIQADPDAASAGSMPHPAAESESALSAAPRSRFVVPRMRPSTMSFDAIRRSACLPACHEN